MCSSQINILDQTDSSGSNVTFLKMQIGNTASHRQGDRGHREGRGDRRSGRRGQRARRPWSAGLTAYRRFSPCVVEPPGRAWGTTATTCVSRRRILPPTGRASPGTPLGGRGQLPWPLHGAVPGTPPRHRRLSPRNQSHRTHTPQVARIIRALENAASSLIWGAHDATGLVFGVTVVFPPCPDLMERESSPFSQARTRKLREVK